MKQVLAVGFNPVVAWNDVHCHEYDEYRSKTEVNVAPVMPAHGKKCLYVCLPRTSWRALPRPPETGGRINFIKAGNGQSCQDDKI